MKVYIVSYEKKLGSSQESWVKVFENEADAIDLVMRKWDEDGNLQKNNILRECHEDWHGDEDYLTGFEYFDFPEDEFHVKCEWWEQETLPKQNTYIVETEYHCCVRTEVRASSAREAKEIAASLKVDFSKEQVNICEQRAQKNC